MNNGKEFKNYISLGYFCSVASELERIGLRSGSGPFDWQSNVDFSKRMEDIENGFVSFFSGLNENSLFQEKKLPKSYYHSLSKTYLVHDFNEYVPLKFQLPNVIEKYHRRVNRFYQRIKEPTLFLHYVFDQKNADWIKNNFTYVQQVLKRYNEKNEILFICNWGILLDLENVFFVEPDGGDVVARKFLDKCESLKNYLVSLPFDAQERKKNLLVYQKKERKKNLLKPIKKIKDCIYKYTKKTYAHKNQI